MFPDIKLNDKRASFKRKCPKCGVPPQIAVIKRLTITYKDGFKMENASAFFVFCPICYLPTIIFTDGKSNPLITRNESLYRWDEACKNKWRKE